jgi:hypothetical protein
MAGMNRVADGNRRCQPGPRPDPSAPGGRRRQAATRWQGQHGSDQLPAPTRCTAQALATRFTTSRSSPWSVPSLAARTPAGSVLILHRHLRPAGTQHQGRGCPAEGEMRVEGNTPCSGSIASTWARSQTMAGGCWSSCLRVGPLKLGSGGQLQPPGPGRRHCPILAGLLDPHRAALSQPLRQRRTIPQQWLRPATNSSDRGPSGAPVASTTPGPGCFQGAPIRRLLPDR